MAVMLAGGAAREPNHRSRINNHQRILKSRIKDQQ
jgi:hypothetical protein